MEHWPLKLDGESGQVLSSLSGAGEALVAFQLCVAECLIPLSPVSTVDLLMTFEVLDSTEAFAARSAFVWSLARVDALVAL